MEITNFLALAVLLAACAGNVSAYSSPELRRMIMENGSPMLRRMTIEGGGSPVPLRRLALENDYCPSSHELLSQRDEYSTFLAAVEVADLQDVLSKAESRITVYAPSNAAFDAFFEGQGLAADDFLGDIELVAQFFRVHLSPAGHARFALSASEQQPMLDCGNTLYSVDNVLLDEHQPTAADQA